MRLGLFVPTFIKDFNRVSASIWIRAYQMIPYLRKLGVNVHVNNPFLPYDAAIIYRSPSKAFFYLTRWLKKTSRRVYFDTAVNYFIRHKFCSAEQQHYQIKLAEHCDGIICSTELIAEAANKFNRCILVMDDPIDLSQFFLIRRRFDNIRPVFGWSGYSVKATYLNKYSRYVDQNIIIISDLGIHKIDLSFRYDYRQWKYETFASALSECDVALLPRQYEGDAYNLGHSSFKALVFAAMGIPIIANALPSYRKLATHYKGIVFLEDYNNNLDCCLQALKGWDSEGQVEDVRSYYSCANQAQKLTEFIF